MLNNCKTKYPILMVHGMGFRDRKYFNYWGRIPKILKENGADIYYGHQDSNGSIETNAYVLKDTVMDILNETKAPEEKKQSVRSQLHKQHPLLPTSENPNTRKSKSDLKLY